MSDKEFRYFTTYLASVMIIIILGFNILAWIAFPEPHSMSPVSYWMPWVIRAILALALPIIFLWGKAVYDVW